MAIPGNIEDILNLRVVESARVEYKSNWNPLPVLHTICAFANDIDNWGGGYIILGVKTQDGLPELPIIGITKGSIDKINNEILNMCNLIEPRYIPVTEHIVHQGKDLFVIWIPGGKNRPYKCPGKLSEISSKSYYIRKLASTIKANAKDVQELFSLSEIIPFDDRINPNADIEDLRPPLILNFLHEVKSGLYETAKTMQLSSLTGSMRIAEGAPEYFKPLNVGLMFFNDRPDNFFRYARIEVVDKPNETGTGMTEKVFTGPLDRQLRDALSYIKNYIVSDKISKFANTEESERIFNYPYAAIEEAVSNAVHHKDYQVPEPVTITVTPDKMEILSFPGPDRSISDESIKALKLIATRYRNRRIGEFLKELHLVEGRNTGIPTILEALEVNGSDLPIFETDEDRSYFRVVFFIHSTFRNVDPEPAPQKPKKKNKTAVKVAILDILSEEPKSSQDLAIHAGYSTHRSGAYLRIIKELMDERKIAFTNPDNPRDKNQRFRLV